ncbi:MAG: UDP-N-acetylmuramate:L-alanyl-gamma-D-glutamyl-meso-diaminopimelate ligase [Legionellales bacterium RIFCSPHIGHO2_12_FULL_42_9]|nr:MAG: UDP-N-acetylmuramate:L-alanyl-gamma-D-glutamyl-meso-diaminopimelate ligase [Legionellales bacterium RIFCSPHIGHO2_12_FULL_42_9]
MHIHILGIGGTFMSALAILARQLGHEVTGCDVNCYPPVSDLLTDQNIAWTAGYDDCQDALRADLVVVGNVIKRGMPVLEAVLNSSQRYMSGPQWIAEEVLPKYRVLAVAGTHGKTTTTSMIAHVLFEAGLEPGFLIGGVAPNFGTSARLGEGNWFVIEADEYDSAFFDKRPKMIHYHPIVAILNNLEFDHADIYPNLEAIKLQFHYYLKTVQSTGVVLKPRDDKALNEVIQKGVFCNLEEFALDGEATWRAEIVDECGSHFYVWQQNKRVAEVKWPLIGRFNVENGLAAISACHHAGVSVEVAASALGSFKPVKRRLEVKLDNHGIVVYDDFAHHPTAIAKTVEALKHSGKHQRVLVVLEFASNTMRSGIHLSSMPAALAEADLTFFLKPTQFDLEKYAQNWHSCYEMLSVSSMIVKRVADEVRKGDAVVIMSNHGFDNIHQDIVTAINRRFNE